MIENKKVITRSLIVLFLSLSIVYSLTYQKKESIFKTTNINWNTASSPWIEEKSTKQISSKNNANEWSSSDGTISLWGLVKSTWLNEVDNKNSNNPQYNAIDLSYTDIKLLPGTTEYFGTLDIVSILWQKPKFTLQDFKWNYFAYYWDYLDFIQTINTLGGNVYEMVTEREILDNQLFGDKVSYINLSTFRDIWVIMVIEIDGEIRLLQIPSDQYHSSKEYLKSLFIQ